VNKKFGGPGAVSPEKYRKPKPRKPVDPALKPKPEKRLRQPLQKTPSESYSQFKAPRGPSLARSATDLGIPRFKREESEVSLFDIPVQRGKSVVARVERLKAQQVDMHAISAATEAKLAQKAKLEEEVKNAINTLKKPNPRQAVKEYVEATEQRSLGSASMRKKTAGPIRKILDDRNVQVAATPRHRKTHAFVPMTGKRERFQEDKEVLPPSSGDFCVPSSTIRPVSGRPTLFSGDRPSKNPPLFSSRSYLDPENAVAETPSRGLSKMRMFPDINTTINNTTADNPTSSAGTLPQDTPCIDATPSRPSTKALHFAPVLTSESLHDPTHPHTPSKSKRPEKALYAPIFATPQKLKSRKAAAVPQTPEAPKNTITGSRDIMLASSPPENCIELPSKDVDIDVDGGKDIYDALGWNDDFDDLA
jgi:DNA replication regulator SLD3